MDARSTATMHPWHACSGCTWPTWFLGASVPDGDVIALDGAAQAFIDAGGPAGDGGVSSGFLLFPQLARRADGKLELAVYRAASEGSGLADLVEVTSSDNGRSFASATTFATEITPTLQRHVPAWLGDYFGWGPTETGLGAAFVDNGSGFSHIVFAETVLSSGAGSNP